MVLSKAAGDRKCISNINTCRLRMNILAAYYLGSILPSTFHFKEFAAPPTRHPAPFCTFPTHMLNQAIIEWPHNQSFHITKKV